MATRKARFVDESYLRYLERKREQEARASDFGRPAPVEEQPPAPAVSTPAEITPPVKPEYAPIQKTPPVVSTPSVVSTPAKGYLRIPNEVVDDILPTLKTSEQAVYLRLYRLSHGFNKPTCHVGLQTLATKCRMSVSQTRFAVRNIEARGLIKTLGVDLSSRERGTTYEVFAPVETKAAVEKRAHVETTPNTKGLTEQVKKEPCARCKDTGWWYPQGVAKGVKRCDHSQMK